MADGTSKGTSIWSRVRGKRLKKDYMLRGAIAIAAVILIITLIPIVQSVIMVNNYHRYVEDYTSSLNHAHRNGGITVVHGDSVQTLDRAEASLIYSVIIEAGMGRIQKAPPEGGDLYYLKFPDGAELVLAATDIKEEARVNDVGLYVSFTNREGRTYRYDTDLIDPRAVLRHLD